MKTNATAASESAVGTVARAAGSLAMLALLVVGVPWLLVTLAGWPLPTRWPDWGGVWLDFRQLNLDRSLIVGVLATAAWLVWAQIVWSLAFEIRNMVRSGRGLTALSAPFTAAAVSALVTRLVAGVVSVTLLSSSSASAGVLSAGQSSTVAIDRPDVETGTATAATAAAGVLSHESNDDQLLVSKVVVGPSETAWDVAVRVFGDGHRVDELLRHNGVSALDVVPGTSLELPPGTDPPPNLDQTTVIDGDHFWALAGDKLAESWGREPTDEELTSYWSDMVALNEDRLLPPGDPDLIYPGQELLFPPVPPVSGVDADTPPSPSQTAAGDTEAAVGAAATVVDEGTSVTESMATAGPASTTEPVPTVEVGEIGEAEASDDADAAAPEPDTEIDAEGTDDVPLGLVAVSGIGLITAAVGAIVARNQARRIGGRRPGTTPRFAVPDAAERLITETADDEALTDLDRALRHVGASLNGDGLALPDLVGVLVGATDIRLLVATPHNAAPEPFTAEHGGMVWSTVRPVPEFDVRQALNPYPTLISIGFTETARLLIDLEYIGSVNLTGGFADVVDAMATMALQLATSPLADTIEVICVGFGEELAELERLTVASSVDGIRSRIDAHAAAVSTLVDVTDNTAPSGRAADVGDWTPMVVFDPLSQFDGESSDLLATAERTTGAGVSAVVNSVDPSNPTGLTMELTEDRVSIPTYDIELDRRPLTRAERTGLTSAVAAAKEPGLSEQSDLASTLGSPAADSPPPDDPPEVEPPSHVVRLLGPLRVEDHAGRPVQFARSATPEFLAYLVHHRAGVEVGHVMNTLWPSTTARRTWIANVYADAARTLGGATPDVGSGVTVTPSPDADDEYRLAGRVSSDVEQFRAILKTAVSCPVDQAVELLTEALTMVEGVPYSNITSRWPITEGRWQEATVMVDEAARCVAVLALDQFDDPALAEWATARGLLASPHSVELHRLRLRAAIALDGQPAGARLSPDAVFQHYQAVVMADDHRPEATSRLDSELVELYESYRRSRPTSARSIDSDTLERQR